MHGDTAGDLQSHPLFCTLDLPSYNCSDTVAETGVFKLYKLVKTYQVSGGMTNYPQMGIVRITWLLFGPPSFLWNG